MPSITRISASAVVRSRISRRSRPYAGLPNRSQRPSGQQRCDSSRRGGGAARGAGRSGGGSGTPGGDKESEEMALRGQHEGRVPAVQRVAIGLQRPVKGKELFVLAKRLGIGLDRLGIAVAAQLLRL